MLALVKNWIAFFCGVIYSSAIWGVTITDDPALWMIAIVGGIIIAMALFYFVISVYSEE